MNDRRRPLARASAWLRTAWGGAALVVTSTLAWLACNGSPVSALPSPEAGGLGTCPATIEATINAACTVPGLRCGPPYTCGFLEANLLCICTSGTFLCTDSVGNEVDAPPTCPGPPPTQTCPSTETAATFATCTEQGRQCFYPSTCASRYDVCQCSAGTLLDGGFGLRFDCDRGTCVNDAGPVVFDSGGADVSPEGSVGDAGTDSSLASEGGGEAGSPEATTPGDASLPGEAAVADSASE